MSYEDEPFVVGDPCNYDVNSVEEIAKSFFLRKVFEPTSIKFALRYKYSDAFINKVIHKVRDLEINYNLAKFEEKLNVQEKETPNIEVKHEGILEVPEGKNVYDLPLSHFVDLANKKGLSKITKALNNLQVWNKNSNKKLSKWAEDMIDKLNKKLGKEESIVKLTINESFGANTFNVKDLENFITKELNKLPMAIGYVDVSLEDDTLLIKIEVPWGDWKHEHKMLDYKLYDIISDYDVIHEFECKLSGNFYKEDEEVTEEDGSDTYSSIHIYRIVLDEDYDYGI